MRPRGEIKKISKMLLSENYGGVLGEFVVMLLALYVTMYLLFSVIYFGMLAAFFPIGMAGIGSDAAVTTAVISITVFSMAISFLVYFVYAPVEVGYLERVRLLWSGEKKDAFFSGFLNGRYWRAVGSKCLTAIFTFLWSLLFLIPGIIKFISYCMTPFIISDSENISPMEAINLSKKITYGYKADICLLYLSFIGWGILSVFTMHLLTIFYVGPYFTLTLAGYYEDIKAKALEDGTVTPSDFGYRM